MPPHPAAPADPNAEDRGLAALAYLSPMFGAWLIGPVCVYFHKRNKSAFVQNHAAQAIVLSLLWVLAPMLFMILPLVSLLPSAGVELPEVVHTLVILVGYLGSVAFVLGLMAAGALGASKAWAGTEWRAPVFGRLAHRVLGAKSQSS